MASVQHCAYCFSVLLAELGGQPAGGGVRAEFNAADEYPLFVTWKKRGELRGCIGNFSALPLGAGLREYALTSALRDSRFPPIALAEVPRLECTVSLLTDFEPARDCMDWEVGRHGIWIEFRCPGSRRTRTATYLPEIAAEQRWTKTEAIDHLLRKGGYPGHITPDVRDAVSLTRYQSSVAHMSYDEYVATCGKP